jgi:hypothetical protein
MRRQCSVLAAVRNMYGVCRLFRVGSVASIFSNEPFFGRSQPTTEVRRLLLDSKDLIYADGF